MYPDVDDPCRQLCDRANSLVGGNPKAKRDCDNCPYIEPLMPENAQAVELIGKMNPGLVTGGMFGFNVNYNLIDTVFNVYQVSAKDRPDLLTKCQVYIELIMEHLQKGDRDGR
jgi:hypothetical protein